MMVSVFGKRIGHKDGAVRIPPLPPTIALTDRSTGTAWVLTWTQNPVGPDGEGYVSIADTWPLNVHPRVYPAWGEPYISNDANLRLFVRDGYLGVDIVQLPFNIVDIDSGPIYAVQGVNRRVVFIHKPDNFVAVNYVLSWIPEVLPS